MSGRPRLGSAAQWAERLLAAMAVPAALHSGGAILAANEALGRLSGRRPEDLRGFSGLALLAPEDRPVVEQAYLRCLRQGETPPALAVRLRTPDGGERPVELHQRPIRCDGRAAVVMTCIDQTDILHVHRSQLALSEMLRQIVDSAPLASLVIDRDHRVLHWNGACERLTGHSRLDLTGTRDHWQPFYDERRPLLVDLIVDGVDAAQLEALYQGRARTSALVPGGIEAEAFFPRIGPSGAWLYLTAAPLRDADGRIIGAIETLQDVTERHRIQEDLLRHRRELEQQVQRRSEQLAATARELERFIINAPVGVAYTSGGQLLRVNHAMAAIFGYSEDALVGMPLQQCHLGREPYEDLGRRASAVLLRGEPLHHEMWMRHAEGHPIWIQIDAHVADREDAGRGTWWMMQDRTEIRAAQQQLQVRFEELQATNRKLEQAQNQLLQQDKMASIGQLAAGVAHEINNPIGFVSSNLNTLRQYVDGLLSLPPLYEHALAAPDDDQVRCALQRRCEEVELDYLREDLPQLLDECADGLGRVKKIVQDLKDFSRVDQAEWQEADLNAGLESTLNVVRHEVKYKADVVRRLAPLPRVLCLAAQLNQVFMNLIVNAVHAIHDHGTLTLSSGASGAWVWVQVDDTGVGMSDEVRRRIFEPFYTTKDVGKGTGLGLSLSFSIVQKHAGALQVRSTPGRGSSFRVWVPVGGPESVVQGAVPPAWPEERALD